RIPGTQTEPSNLVGTDVDVIRPRKIIRLRGSQETKAIGQDFEHTVAGNRHIVFGELLKNSKHHVLLAQGRGIFDLQLFSKSEQFGGALPLQFFEIHGGLCVAIKTGWPRLTRGTASGLSPKGDISRRRIAGNDEESRYPASNPLANADMQVKRLCKGL